MYVPLVAVIWLGVCLEMIGVSEEGAINTGIDSPTLSRRKHFINFILYSVVQSLLINNNKFIDNKKETSYETLLLKESSNECKVPTHPAHAVLKPKHTVRERERECQV